MLLDLDLIHDLLLICIELFYEVVVLLLLYLSQVELLKLRELAVGDVDVVPRDHGTHCNLDIVLVPLLLVHYQWVQLYVLEVAAEHIFVVVRGKGLRQVGVRQTVLFGFGLGLRGI